MFLRCNYGNSVYTLFLFYEASEIAEPVMN